MKKFSLLIFATLFLLTSCEYNPGVSEAFTKYRFKEGVTTITVPGWVIGMASKFSKMDEDESDLLSSIDKVRILVVENEELNTRINLHNEFSTKINKKGDFEELMTVTDDGANITVFGKMNENVITEMVLLIGGDDNAMIYVRGEIDPKLVNDAIYKSNKEKLFSFNF